MPTIVHFEIPTDNVERSKKFYSGSDGISRKCHLRSYLREKSTGGITTKDHEGNNAVNGGMMKRMMPEQQGILNSIGVSSVDEYSAKVEQLGGKIKLSKMAIPNMGYFAVCSDTENNTFGLWEADTTAK